MRLSRTEWAKQRGSKRSVRKRKPDNEFKKEITRSKRGMHPQGAGKLREYLSEVLILKKEGREDMEIKMGEQKLTHPANTPRRAMKVSRMNVGPFY